jgi:hypothetical protein
MTDEESEEIYERLRSILDQRGLHWVTSQVGEQLRLGKLVHKEAKTLRETEFAAPLFAAETPGRGWREGPKFKFPVTVPYEPKERLSLLIDAIQLAVVATSEMEDAFTGFFQTNNERAIQIAFYGEDDPVEVHTFDVGSVLPRREDTNRLKSSCEALRAEIRK